MEKGFITLMNTNIYYEASCSDPSKPSLLLLHGYLSSTFSFRHLIPLLTRYFNIYAIDLPGFGNSEKNTRFYYSLDNYAELAGRFCVAKSIRKCAIAGHSMGGQIALRAARKHPGIFNKVIGISAAGYMGRLKPQLRLFTYLPLSHLFLQIFFKRKKPFDVIKEVVHHEELIVEDMIEGYTRPFRERSFFKTLALLGRHREGDLNPSELREIQQRVLLIWGENDKIVPLSIGKRLENDLPFVTLEIFPETGHLVPEERPELVAAAYAGIHRLNQSLF